jgi:hypothetical protein
MLILVHKREVKPPLFFLQPVFASAQAQRQSQEEAAISLNGTRELNSIYQ